MSWETTLHLQKYFFTEREKPLAEYAGMTASVFLYPSGVHGLRITNKVGQMIMLPFQGQQIWDIEFFGRTLTMKSMFDGPNATQDYLQTYGGFLLHCGATAMGVPTAEDDHPVHGELPNAPYQTAQLLLGEDEGGVYMAVTGAYRYTVAFNHNCLARPVVKLYADASQVSISITIKNLKQSDMNLMYLAHVNFRPVDYGRLVYSAPCTPEKVRIRQSIPAHIMPPAGYREFLAELEANPAKHNILDPTLTFDPEVVLYVDYQADEAGWAHTMQIHPDGAADFISHRPTELAHGVRWISRTVDQAALGMTLPATAEPEGYSAEKAKGNLQILPAGEEVTFHLKAGALAPEAAKTLEAKIGEIVG